MTITHPRPFPSPHGLAVCTVRPLSQIVRAPTRGSQQQVVELAPEILTIDVQTIPLTPLEAGGWEAWFASMAGGSRTFQARDVMRVPLAYPDGAPATRALGGAYDGTATLDTATASTVTLSGLPNGYLFHPGDRLSFSVGSVNSLHRVTEAAAASALGAVTLSVESSIPTGWATDAEVQVTAPWFTAVIDPDTWQTTTTVDNLTTISFSGYQTR
jgi:hypothetical protein